MRELIVDSFAGGGGASLGIHQALGRSPDIAINHDPGAIAMHTANHPETRHYIEDVWKVSPREVTRGRRVGLLWASPDCFPAGTLVLTSSGYRPIEQVRVGELVLTHKNRWRPVTATMSSVKSVRTIRGHGHPGLTVSDEHPFYVSHRTNVWDNEGRRYKSVFGSAGWVNAGSLMPLADNSKGKSGDYWATPITFEPLPVPMVGGRGLNLDRHAWWLIGRYLADGWAVINDKSAELVFSCSLKKLDEMRRHVGTWDHGTRRAGENQLTWRERRVGSNARFYTSHRGLVEYLREHFGHLAHNKRLPGWALGMPEENRHALLAGYTAGDGYDDGIQVRTSTVSPALAYGIKSLATSLGYTVSVYAGNNGGTRLIEGREVNTKNFLCVHWRHNIAPNNRQTFDSDGHRFSPIREVMRGEKQEVFNISVLEDESYVVEGIVGHNCKHFSRAKGSKPVSKNIRSLAWVIVRWAEASAPRVIALENVREFEDWGPLVPLWTCRRCQWRGTEGQATLVRTRRRCPQCESVMLIPTEVEVPDPGRKGLTFRRFVGRLRNLGYDVEWKVLNAADFGAPTHRRRLFLIARNDGAPIVWPEPTHGDPKKIQASVGDLFAIELKPWRSASEIIDWSIPCPSIFERKKPLADKTLRRIALGIKRYVLDNPSPFIVRYNTEKGAADTHSKPLSVPLGTVTADPRFGLVTPLFVPLTHQGERRANAPNEPLPTVTGANRGEQAIVAPTLARIGQTGGNGKYANSVEEPLTTVTSKAEHVVVSPTLIQVAYGEKGRWGDGTQDLGKPLNTIHAGGKNYALCAAFLAKHFGGMVGVPADTPLPTTTVRGTQNQIVAANLVHMNHGEKQWNSADEPMRTITTGNHAALVYSFLTKFFGTAIGTSVDGPLPTATAKDRFGLVTVMVEGEPYVIVDIGMRMLTPRELARAQGFPDDYQLTGSKTNQVARIGNSVVPAMAKVLVEANYHPSPVRAA